MQHRIRRTVIFEVFAAHPSLRHGIQTGKLWKQQIHQGRGGVEQSRPNKTAQWKLSVTKIKNKKNKGTHFSRDNDFKSMESVENTCTHTVKPIHFCTVEVRCSQIRRGCSYNIHVVRNPDLFLYTETVKHGSGSHESEGSFLAHSRKLFLHSPRSL